MMPKQSNKKVDQIFIFLYPISEIYIFFLSKYKPPPVVVKRKGYLKVGKITLKEHCSK